MTALSGLRIIDLTRVLSGPYATQILGDHGADIVKVEPPQGDEVRDWGPPFRGDDAAYFLGINRNKRSIGLDLAMPAGREVLLRLLAGADALIENYKPGTLERWGLDYDTCLAERFPRLVHCRITGFGAEGPLGGAPGYDAVLQAVTGHMSVNGDPGSGATRIGIPLVDLGCGLYAALAVMTALWERERSGRGQFIDMTLYDVGIALMHPHIPNYLISGSKIPGLTGNAHPNISPYDKFSTRTGDIFIAVGNDATFGRLCAELGLDTLPGDERFRTNAGRVANRDVLRAELANALADHDATALCQQLLRRGVPAGPVQDTAEVMRHPHTAHREMLVQREDYQGWGLPIKLSRTPGAINTPPPAFSANGREILREVGYAAEEVDDLARQGVLVETRRRPR